MVIESKTRIQLKRTLRHEGFILDHVGYYSNTSAPIIADRRRHGKFVIRRDPRDLSRIYVFDPMSQKYLEIPYRTLSRPSIMRWQHRYAMKDLQKRGLEKWVNSLFLVRLIR